MKLRYTLFLLLPLTALNLFGQAKVFSGGGSAGSSVTAGTNIVVNSSTVSLADPATLSQVTAATVVATNLLANLINSTNLAGTNVVGFVSTFPSQSNAVNCNNGEWLLQSAGPVSLRNAIGSIAGQRTWALLSVSNSGASTFTNFSTIPNARYIGQATTNALAIPSGKIGQWLVEIWGGLFTNVFNCLQQ